ncbi:type II secretion system protein [Cerasicoccus arenae]|nr:type II secretion system protein [Cerasicoccus arenae]MBK1858975.1 type II secretion system protein [Cerasicoccus arenae]
MSRPRKNSRAAFTLVELLTVIAIIGILATILIPVVGHVRQQGKLASSTSRLRNLGQAAILHTADHQGEWPRSTHAYDRKSPQWWLALSPYLWNEPITSASNPAFARYHEQMLRDPLDVVEQNDGTHANRFSYGFNVYLQLGEHDDYEGKPTRWNKNFNVPFPESTVIFATNKLETSDHFMAHYWVSRTDAEHDLDARNGEQAGIAYCDGHVEWVAPSETYDPSNGINHWNPSLAGKR